jgi:NADH-ubiquinone oxidoreductase chain 5
MFMSGLVANFEYDLKKIIALSTLRQLGLIIFSISLGLYDLAFFHLIMHALFKAMLFLCAGAIIHVIGGSQDIRVCGSLIRRAPLLASCINYANLSLSGIPFLAGFYSKDSIVEFARIGTLNVFILCLIFVSIGLTIAYRLRLSYFLFIKTSSKAVRSNTYELDSLVIYPILFLTVVSVPSGAIFIRTLCFPLAIILPASLKIIALVIVVLGIVRANSPRWYRNYSTISFINSSI